MESQAKAIRNYPADTDAANGKRLRWAFAHGLLHAQFTVLPTVFLGWW